MYKNINIWYIILDVELHEINPMIVWYNFYIKLFCRGLFIRIIFAMLQIFWITVIFVTETIVFRLIIFVLSIFWRGDLMVGQIGQTFINVYFFFETLYWNTKQFYFMWINSLSNLRFVLSCISHHNYPIPLYYLLHYPFRYERVTWCISWPTVT